MVVSLLYQGKCSSRTYSLKRQGTGSRLQPIWKKGTIPREIAPIQQGRGYTSVEMVSPSAQVASAGDIMFLGHT
jgi:hypothetical protein